MRKYIKLIVIVVFIVSGIIFFITTATKTFKQNEHIIESAIHYTETKYPYMNFEMVSWHYNYHNSYTVTLANSNNKTQMIHCVVNTEKGNDGYYSVYIMGTKNIDINHTQN